MALRICICLVFVAALFLNPLTAEADILKPKLAAIPFVAKNIEAMGVTEYLTSVLLNELERGGFVEVIERRRLEGGMDLEGIRGQNLSKPDLQRLGVRVGADYLVSGTVATNLNGMQLELAVLSVRTQQMVFADQLLLNEGEAPKLLRGLSDRIRQAFQGVNSAAAQQAAAAARPVAAVTSLEATGSTNSIRLRWKHQEPGRVVGYMVLRSGSEQGPFSTIATVIEPAFTDENLRLNETYYYRITAISQGGVMAEPSVVQRGGTSVAPAVPIFMNAEPLLAGALLSWRQRPGTVTDPRTEPKGVRIYRKTGAEKEFLPVAKVPAGEGGTVYRDYGLKDGETYLYLITAYNQAEAESEQSVQLSVQAPPLVSGLAAVSDKVRRIQLSWDQHSFSGTTGYRLLRSSAQDGQYQELALLADRTKTGYTDSNLADKSTYWYKVIPISKESGTGGASKEVSATTRDLPPTPSNLTGSKGEARQVVLKWDFNSVPDDEIAGFYLYRSESGAEKLTRLTELPPERREYRDRDDRLKHGGSYDYLLASYNSSGAVSKLSNKITATTKPLPEKVAGLQLQERATRLVSWKKSAEPDVVKYHIYKKGFLGWQKVTTQSGTEWRSAETGRQELYVTAEDSDGLESDPSDILIVE